MKRALIVAPHFAPINAPDGTRVRLNLPYYRKNGWAVEVLAVKPKFRPDWRDDGLLQTLPADVPIHRCGAVPLLFSRLVGVGTMGWRSLPFLLLTGTALLQRKRFDLIVFSTTQFPSLFLGPLWKKVFGIPYVIDLQDHWYTDFYHRPGAPNPPGGWKYHVTHRLSSFMEPLCFRRAAGFSMVSEDYRKMLKNRYPWFHKKPSITLPFAAPVDDFRRIPEEKRRKPPHMCRYIGALNPAFRTSLNAFFEMVAKARKAKPTRWTWRFEFTGTSYAGPNQQARSLAMEAAKEYGMADVTTESTKRVSYFESLRLMKSANLILILGSDEMSYTPSRLATAVAAGTPVLVIGAKESRLVQRASQIPKIICVDYGNLKKASFQSRLKSPLLPKKYIPKNLAKSENRSWNKVLKKQKF